MEEEDKAHVTKLAMPFQSESDMSKAPLMMPLTAKARGGGKRHRLNDTEECRGVRGPAWKDAWVYHLIHIRGQMNDDFVRPPKQGLDLWGSVCSKLESACADFDKSQESCRKKWRHIYKEYREDRAAQKGNEDTKKCKWYYLIDEYMHDRAHIPEPPPPPPPPPIISVALAEEPIEADTDSILMAKGLTKARSKLKEEDIVATITSRVDQMVENSAQLLQKFDQYEKEKVTLLRNLNETLKEFMCILKESS